MRKRPLTLSGSLTLVAIVALLLALGLSLKDRPVTAEQTGSRAIASNALDPGDREICAVCGMFVARYPEWIAQVVYEDGSSVYFDGPKDLFKYLLEPEKYAKGRTSSAIAAVLVTGYYDRDAIEARGAFFVTGSDVVGPMGAELVPHRALDDARKFMADHGGDRVVRFEEVDPNLLAELHMN